MTWQYAKSVLLWPLEIGIDGRRQYILGERIVYESPTGKWLTVQRGYMSDHSSVSPNLRHADGCIVHYRLMGYPVTARYSRAPFLHDLAHDRAQWDDGSWMTFGQANKVMLHVMYGEGWPRCVIRQWQAGIYSAVGRHAWNSHDDGRPLA